MPTGDAVYLVTKVELIPFDPNFMKYEQLNQEVIKYVTGVKQLLEEGGFYFSYHADLTSNQQRFSTLRIAYPPGPKNYSYK